MSEQEFIEVVQIIEKDEPDVQPSQGQEEGEEEQAKPDAVALAGLHLLFGIFLPVAAVQAVEAAGPDGAAAGGICHGEGLPQELPGRWNQDLASLKDPEQGI